MTTSTAPGRPTWTMVGLIAGLLNMNFVAQVALAPRTSMGTTIVSDLSSPGQPWSGTFRLADSASAIAVLVLCWAAWRRRRMGSDNLRRGWPWAAATIALALFAASTITAALVPVHCDSASALICSQPVREQSWPDLVHDLVSSVGTSLGVLAAVGYAKSEHPRSARWVGHLLAFAGAAASGAMFLVLQSIGDTLMLGWVQRLQILTLSSWFGLVGWSVDARCRAELTSSG